MRSTYTEVITQWTESAPYWKHPAIIRDTFALVTQPLTADPAITARDAVLDVAKGPGEPAFSIENLIGSEGKVVGTKPVPEIVEAARRDGFRRGLYNSVSSHRWSP